MINVAAYHMWWSEIEPSDVQELIDAGRMYPYVIGQMVLANDMSILLLSDTKINLPQRDIEKLIDACRDLDLGNIDNDEVEVYDVKYKIVMKHQ